MALSKSNDCVNCGLVVLYRTYRIYYIKWKAKKQIALLHNTTNELSKLRTKSWFEMTDGI